MSRSDRTCSRRDLLFGLFQRMRGPSEAPPVVSGVDGKALSGDAAMASGELGQAVMAYRQCLHQAPEQAEVRAKLGHCLYRQGRYVQASCEFTRVLRQKEDNLSALYLGLAQARLGRQEEAVAALRRYFNPQAVAVQREVNLQLALLETSAPPELERVVAAIEEALAEQSGPGV